MAGADAAARARGRAAAAPRALGGSLTQPLGSSQQQQQHPQGAGAGRSAAHAGPPGPVALPATAMVTGPNQQPATRGIDSSLTAAAAAAAAQRTETAPRVAQAIGAPSGFSADVPVQVARVPISQRLGLRPAAASLPGVAAPWRSDARPTAGTAASPAIGVPVLPLRFQQAHTGAASTQERLVSTLGLPRGTGTAAAPPLLHLQPPNWPAPAARRSADAQTTPGLSRAAGALAAPPPQALSGAYSNGGMQLQQAQVARAPLMTSSATTTTTASAPAVHTFTFGFQVHVQQGDAAPNVPVLINTTVGKENDSGGGGNGGGNAAQHLLLRALDTAAAKAAPGGPRAPSLDSKALDGARSDRDWEGTNDGSRPGAAAAAGQQQPGRGGPWRRPISEDEEKRIKQQARALGVRISPYLRAPKQQQQQ